MGGLNCPKVLAAELSYVSQRPWGLKDPNSLLLEVTAKDGVKLESAFLGSLNAFNIFQLLSMLDTFAFGFVLQ